MTLLEEAMEESLPEYTLAKEFYEKYDVKGIVGRGASCTVRRCIEKDTGHEYAVKVIDITGEKGSGLIEEGLEATMKEMNILRMCHLHPNIIEIHEAFETPTYMFIVLELCKRGELFEYLTEVVALPERQTRHLMRQLLEAVEFIHSKNIVHRDLKPENILLDDSMNIKVTDFGLAMIVSDDKELSDLVGTPGYLAPEVLKAAYYDDAPGYGRPVDMWACGVIMYTLLVGCPPFWHRLQIYMIRAIMEGNYNFDSPEWNDVSLIAKDLVSKLLVVDPSQRLTASQALQHIFIKCDDVKSVLRKKNGYIAEKELEQFQPKRLFRVYVHAVLATIYFRRHPRAPPAPPRLADISRDPYDNRDLRKAVDACAFRIYGHWVKKGDNQNRGALFENSCKRDLVMLKKLENARNDIL